MKKILIQKKILIILSSVLFTFLLLDIVDTLLGKVTNIKIDDNNSNIFLLPPNKRIVYKQYEFSFEVITNSLGFRGKEYKIQKPSNTIRIMTVGDSFTFGWGVSLEDTWPFLLEKELNNKFKNKKFEVLNFGRPGFAPYDYLEIVKKYLPIYKPDYLLIGILEGEDIFPLIPAQAKQKKSLDANRTKEILDADKNKKAIPNILKQLYPHLFALVSLNKPIEVSETFSKRVREYLSHLDEEGIKKWDSIDPFYKKLFLEGKLQSGLLDLIIAYPSVFVKILDTQNQEVISGYDKLTSILKEIYDIANENGVKVAVIDIPYPVFVEKESSMLHKAMGFDTTNDSWLSDIPMIVAKQSAEKAGVNFFPNLTAFRKFCNSDCFYQYDGHMNTKGYELLASSVFESLSRLIAINN